MSGAILLHVRGRLRLLRRDRAAATEDLRRCGRTMEDLGYRNPSGYAAWRSTLAGALATEDAGEALRLAHAELADARRIGLPRAIGVALRTAGVIERGERGLTQLQEAVRVLDASPARLEHARALVELGAALRRANRRAEAREPLRAGLDRARSCGATRLAEHAHAELVAAGAKPRREAVSGVESLDSNRGGATLRRGGRAAR